MFFSLIFSDKSINTMLDYVSMVSEIPFDIIEDWYDVTKRAALVRNTERLYTKICIKLAYLWFSRHEWHRLTLVLGELRANVLNDKQSDTQMHGTNVLELYSLEIQMYQEMHNVSMVKKIFQEAMNVSNAIPHPRTMGVIREFGGKMYMEEKDWEAAQVNFFQAFRNYDEAGSPQRIQVLKYLVLANMLMGSSINLFDSQETKPYVTMY